MFALGYKCLICVLLSYSSSFREGLGFPPYINVAQCILCDVKEGVLGGDPIRLDMRKNIRNLW